MITEKLIQELKKEGNRMGAQPFKIDNAPSAQKSNPLPAQTIKPLNPKPLPMNPVAVPAISQEQSN